MKPNVLVGVVAAGAVAVCGLGWLMLPTLQAEQAAVDRQASEHLERARRLLHHYNAGLEYKSMLLDSLRRADIDVDIENQQELLESAEEEYRELHAAQWALYPPVDWGEEDPVPVKASYGNLSGQIKGGLQARKTLFSENGKLLDRSLSAVNEALAVRSDSGSANAHAESLRLKGTILYHLGLRQRIGAGLIRREARSYLDELADLAVAATAVTPLQALVANSNVDGQIGTLRGKVAEAEAAIAKDRKALAELDGHLRDLEARRTTAQARAAEARRSMEQLIASGVDSHDPQGVETFKTKLVELDRAYRGAVREAQTLQFGDYANADIDASGDYLTGAYVRSSGAPATEFQHGLAHGNGERTVIAQRVEVAQRALEDLRSDIARLEAQKNAGIAQQERAGQELASIQSEARKAYEEYERLRAEALASEDKALGFFDQASGAARQAGTAANQWVSDAREHLQNLSDESRQRSASSKRVKDGWMSAYNAVQEADAQLAKAWIHSSRYESAGEAARILALAIQNADLQGVEVDAEQAQATDAQEAGVAAINQAIAVLERAFREANKHWTLVAQQAGTVYVLALLGYPGFATDAIEAYRASVKGREDKAFAQRIVSRLKRLELMR